MQLRLHLKALNNKETYFWGTTLLTPSTESTDISRLKYWEYWTELRVLTILIVITEILHTEILSTLKTRQNEVQLQFFPRPTLTAELSKKSWQQLQRFIWLMYWKNQSLCLSVFDDRRVFPWLQLLDVSAAHGFIIVAVVIRTEWGPKSQALRSHISPSDQTPCRESLSSLSLLWGW